MAAYFINLLLYIFSLFSFVLFCSTFSYYFTLIYLFLKKPCHISSFLILPIILLSFLQLRSPLSPTLTLFDILHSFTYNYKAFIPLLPLLDIILHSSPLTLLIFTRLASSNSPPFPYVDPHFYPRIFHHFPSQIFL